MKIQLALDRLSIQNAIALGEEVREYVDWIEVGTSLIKEYGMESVRALKNAFPEKKIVADMKTIDNSNYEFELCFKAGADVATVMGVAPSITIANCLEVAATYNKEVMIDLLQVNEQQFKEISTFTKAIFCQHLSKDLQESASEISLGNPLYKNEELTYAVAGGISADSFSTILVMKPEVVIIGSAITQSANPKSAAKFFYDMARKKGDEA
jgi:3-hexulose-6-phosphate synthase